MQNQKAIFFFLLKFIGVYLVLNTIYALWIAAYSPLPDPLTEFVTRNTVALLNLFEHNVTVGAAFNKPTVPILQNGNTIVSVFEGCNSLNVMIVFTSFVVAFTGTLKRTAVFLFIGIVLIYIFNLVRVGVLFLIAKYYPHNLYFFHKYLFTGLLYALVFVLWYVWVKNLWSSRTE